MHTIYHSSHVSWSVIARAIFMSIVLLVATASIARGQTAFEVKNGATSLLLIETGGDVGIGLANPFDKLSVGGDISTTGVYKINGTTVFNNSGTQSIFLGVLTGQNNTGTHATFVGYSAGKDNQGNDNIFIGREAGRIATGDENTFVGSRAGFDNTTGLQNTFIGYRAGYENISGDHNTYIGHLAGDDATGSDNTFVGYQSGRLHSSGNDNTFVGYQAGHSNIGGSGNVFIGHQAGELETGSDKLYIHNSNVSNPLIHGDFNIRRLTINGVTEVSNTIRPLTSGNLDLGSAGLRWNIVFANSVNTTSDFRLKENIQDLSYGLQDILHLRPVSYTWKGHSPQEVKLGLIAQEIQPIIKEVVHVGDDPEQTMGLYYSDLIPVLIKSIQEQQAIIDQQQAQFDTLAATLEHLAQTRSRPNNSMAGLLGSGLCLLLVLVSVGRNKRRPIATVE